MAVAEQIAAAVLPLTVTSAGLLMLFSRRRDYFGAFLSGAKEGLGGAIRLLPTLTALIVAVRMLMASGICDWLSSVLARPAGVIGLPPDLIPLVLTRPFSGSASLAAYSELLGRIGADSFGGLCASVVMGASDTFVYILTVYFSSVGVRKTRYAFPLAIASMLFSLFFSCLLCRLWYK